jgi:hypothetical protein
LTQPELAHDLRSGVSRAIRLSHPHKFMPHQSTKSEQAIRDSVVHHKPLTGEFQPVAKVSN